MTKDTRNSLISGVLFFIFGLYLYLSGVDYQTKIRLSMNADIGAAFLPRVIGIFIIVLSIGLLASTAIPYLIKRKTAVTENVPSIKPEQRVKKNSLKVLFTVIFMFLYMILLSPLGFILSSIIYLFAQMALIEGKLTKKKSMLFGVISLIAPILTYVLFVNVFSLMLPAGILG